MIKNNLGERMKRLKCKRCSREWDYTGNNEWWATCPTCLAKVKVYGNNNCIIGDINESSRTDNQ